MDKQITTLGFSLKEIYDQIGYTFKSDLLCLTSSYFVSFIAHCVSASASGSGVELSFGWFQLNASY